MPFQREVELSDENLLDIFPNIKGTITIEYGCTPKIGNGTSIN
jgi:hypothetical protein